MTAKFRIRRSYLAIAIAIVWGFMAIYGIMNHEMWRDEMRALSIAISAPSYLDLPALLKNEGHPILWYFVLKLSFDIFNTTLVLPILSILFASGIVYLLLFRSPFPLLFSVLIIFGTWCLYDYGVNCRNYGIGAFFLLLFADVYARKPKQYLLQAALLALAAQTNIYATIIAAFSGLWMLLQMPREDRFTLKTIAAFGIIGIPIVFSIVLTLPDKNSLAVDHQLMEAENLLQIWDIGYGFGHIVYLWFPTLHGFVTTMLWLSLLLFIPKPKSLVLLYASAMVMTFFSLCIRVNYIQHQGMWIYFFILLFRIHYEDIKVYTRAKKGWRKYFVYTGLLAFSCILLSNTVRGLQAWQTDIRLPPLSDSKGAGNWFRKNINPEDVLIAEPDYIMEPVMYYHYHPFYLPREKTFNSFVHFTKANDSFLALTDMIRTADSFDLSGRKSYIILREKPGFKDSTIKYTWGKHFTVDSSALNELGRRYIIADSFKHSFHTDEQYFIYRKK